MLTRPTGRFKVRIMVKHKTNTKEKVIIATQELMTSRGYSATTVDEIIKYAGVSKGGFYHAFKSKEELTIVALEDYEEKGWEIVANGAYAEIEDPVERALAFVQFLEEKSGELWAHGCLLGSISIEVANSHPSVINRIDELFDDFEKGIEVILAPALETKKITEVSGKDLSIHLLAVIEGSIITAKSHRNPRFLQDGIARFRHYLSLLLKHDGVEKKSTHQ